MKILIIHDRFQFRGGAERLVLDLAKDLKADLATEFWTKDCFDQSEAPGNVFVIEQGEAPMIVWRYFRAQWNFFWKLRHIIPKYDAVIFSGNNCLAAGFWPKRTQTRVFYCHTPVRYVYDLLPLRRAAEPSRIKRFFYYDLGKWLIRANYRLALSRMPVVVANSRAVQERLKTYCHRDAQIVYPPIQTRLFQWIDQEPYYLSYARLDPLKRIESIIRAFRDMPEKRLKIASSGPSEQELRWLAQGCPNIEFVGRVSDEELKELIGRCTATIYIPIQEDFGMTPLEGMAAGKPCIGVAEGGLKETILEGKTGFLIPEGASIPDLMHAVQTLTPEHALSMRTACEDQARKFDVSVFLSKMRTLIGLSRS